MKFVFPFIKLESKNYPSVIMGEDNFTGWWTKGKFNSEKERANEYKKTLEVAYGLGVRGFGMSPHKTLIKVIKNFKKLHPDIICISNHHWMNNYYIGKSSLWGKENIKKLLSTEKYYLDKKLWNSEWFKNLDIKNRFSKKEIKQIKLNEKEYLEQLKKFRKFCDFCLVGNLGASSLIILKRKDIIEREIELTRKIGFIPVGMCEGGGLTLAEFEKLNVVGEWIWINNNFSCPNLNHSLKEIKKSKKPITAYKIFSNGKFNLEKSMNFIKSVPQIKSIVVGVENSNQAKKTFSKLQKYFN